MWACTGAEEGSDAQQGCEASGAEQLRSDEGDGNTNVAHSNEIINANPGAASPDTASPDLANPSANLLAPYKRKPKPLKDKGPEMDANGVERRCLVCGTTETPKWRCGMTLCNACGLRNAKRVSSTPSLPDIARSREPG